LNLPTPYRPIEETLTKLKAELEILKAKKKPQDAKSAKKIGEPQRHKKTQKVIL
jgi:hypothetical protein